MFHNSYKSLHVTVTHEHVSEKKFSKKTIPNCLDRFWWVAATGYLNELNLQLQGRNKTAIGLQQKCKSFQAKLELFDSLSGQTHFATFVQYLLHFAAEWKELVMSYLAGL